MKARPASRSAKPFRPLRGSIAALLALGALAQAGQIWDGGGANGLWSNALNWDADTLPNFATPLQFGGLLQLAANNDATASATGLTFLAGAGAFTLSGNALTLTGGITNSSAAVQTAGFGTTGITLGAAQTFDAGTVVGGGLAVTAKVALGGNTLTIDGTNNTTLSSAITGTGGVLKNGTGKLTITGPNTFSGGTTLANGALFADSNTALGTGTLTITSAGGSTTLGSTVNGTTLTNALSVQSNFSIATSTVTTNNFFLNGSIDLNGGTRVLTGVTDKGQVHFGGVVSNGGLTLTTAGLLPPAGGVHSFVAFIFEGANASTYTGLTTVDAEAFLVFQSAVQKISGDVLVQGNGVVDYIGVSNQIADTATVTVNSAGSNIGGAPFAGFELRGQSDVIGTLLGTGTVGLGSGTLTVGAGNFSGAIGNGGFGGGGKLTKNTAGTLILSGANTYTGQTTITAGTLKAGSATALSSGSAFNVQGTLDFGGFTNTVAGLSGLASGVVENVGATPATLTFGGNNSAATYAGVIRNGTGGSALSITKTGTGVEIFSGANSYTGPTTISAGTLEFAKTLALYNNTAANWTPANIVVASGATLALNVGGVGEFAAADVTTLLDGTHLGASTVATGLLSGARFGLDTTNAPGGTFAYDTVIANAGANSIGLVKLGAGTLTFNAANTYTGPTTVLAGTLAPGPAGSIASASTLTVDGATAVFDLGASHSATVATVTLANGGSIIGSGTSALTSTGTFEMQIGSVRAILAGAGIALNKTTVGTVTLSGANTYTGATTVLAGTLAEGPAGSIADTSTLTVNGATAIFDLGANHSDTVATVTLQNGGRITGSGTSALTSTGTFEMQSGSVSAILAGVGIALNKTTIGTITLTGANTYTGVTTVSAGTLQFAKTAALYNNTPASWVPAKINVSSGATLAVNVGGAGEFSAADVTTLLDGAHLGGSTAATGLENNSSIGLDTTNAPGGTFAYDTVIANPNAGANVLGLTKLGTGTLSFNVAETYTGPTLVLGGTLAEGPLGSIADASALTVDGATSVFDLGANHNDTVASVTLLNGGTITGSGTSTLSSTGSFNLQSGVVSANLGGTGGLNKTTAGMLTLTGVNTYTGPTTIAAGILRAGSATALSPGSAFNVQGTLDLAGFSNTVAGLSGPASGIVQNVSSTPATLTFGSNNANVTFAGTIINGASGSALSLTKAGTGVEIFTGANTYTGQTTIAAGTLKAGSATAFSSGSAFNVQGTLDLGGFTNTVAALSGSATGVVENVGASPAALTFGGNNSDAAFAGVIRDGTGGSALSITKTGTGTETLSGVNTYTGATRINAGTLQFAQTVSLYNTTPASWVPTKIIVQNGATLALNVGGAGEFAAADVVTLLDGAHLGASTPLNGLRPGSRLGLDTTNAPGGTFAYNTVIANPGANSLGLTKLGTGTLTFNAANTYTGPTTVLAGTLAAGPAGSIASASTLTVNGATAVFDLGANHNATVTKVTLQNGGSITGSGTSTLTTTSTFELESGSVGANLAGAGAPLNKITLGTVTLSGANTYTGQTSIVAGTLQFAKTVALYNNTPASWVPAKINVSSGATLAVNVGGAGEFSAADVTTLLDGAHLGGSTAATGLENNSSIGLDTTNAPGGTFAYDTVIANPNAGANVLGLTKLGTGTLSFNVAETYTGPTLVLGGTLAEGPLGSIADASALTVDGATSVFDLGANHNDTVASVTLLNGGTITGSGTSTLSSTGSFNLQSGVVSANLGGTGGLNKTTAGTLTLTGVNTYTGQTSVSAGTLKAGSTTAFSPGSAFFVNGTLDLAGFSNTVGSLGGLATGVVENVSATPATLTLGGDNSSPTFQGTIIDGVGGSALSIRKVGTGKETFSGANTYTGGTTLENGALIADSNTALGTGTLTINAVGGPVTLGSTVNGTTLTNAISVQSDFSISTSTQPTNNFSLNGPIDLNGGTRVITGLTNQGQVHFGGVISNGGVTFTTSGLPAPVAGVNSFVAFIYDGTAQHTYTGLTTVDGNAFLVLGNTGQRLPGNVLIQGSGVVDYFGFSDQLADTASVTVNSAGSTITGGSHFAGLELRGNSDRIGALFGSAAGTVGLGSGVLTVGAGNFAGVIGDGAVSGAGTGGQLVKNTSGTLTLTGANTYTGNTNINNGTLVLDGSVQSPFVAVNFSGTLMGTGTVAHTLINAGVFSPGHSPGTFHIGGNFVQTGAGTTVIEIAGKNPGQHDLITVGGQASLDGSLRIVKLGGARLKVGDKVTFLTAVGSVTGRFRNVDNAFATGTLVSANVVYGSNDVSLDFVQGSFRTLESRIKLTPNEKIIGKQLDRLVRIHREPKLIDLLDREPLDRLPHDFDLLAAEELASVYTIGFSQANVQTANLQRRLDDVRAGVHGFSAEGLSVTGTGEQAHAVADPAAPLAGLNGPTGTGGKELRAPEAAPAPAGPVDRRFGTFITGVGEFSRVSNTANARGYDLATGGFTLGADYRLTPAITVGLSTGYARTGANLTGGGRVTVDGAKLGAYATYFDEGLYVDAALQGGYNSYDTRRTALRGTASGSTTGSEVNALLATGYDFTSDALRIGPTASFQYTHLGLGGFRESGPLVPLNLPAQSTDSARTAIGLKAAYEFRLASGVVVRPEGRLAWQHELGDIAYGINARLASGGGKVFTVQGAETGRDSALLGLGVSVLWSERTAAYLFYDGEVGRAKYTSNNVSGGLRMTF